MVAVAGVHGEGANGKRFLAKVQKNVCNSYLLTLRYPYQGNTLKSQEEGQNGSSNQVPRRSTTKQPFIM